MSLKKNFKRHRVHEITSLDELLTEKINASRATSFLTSSASFVAVITVVFMIVSAMKDLECNGVLWLVTGENITVVKINVSFAIGLKECRCIVLCLLLGIELIISLDKNTHTYPVDKAPSLRRDVFRGRFLHSINVPKYI